MTFTVIFGRDYELSNHNKTEAFVLALGCPRGPIVFHKQYAGEHLQSGQCMLLCVYVCDVSYSSVHVSLVYQTGSCKTNSHPNKVHSCVRV